MRFNARPSLVLLESSQHEKVCHCKITTNFDIYLKACASTSVLLSAVQPRDVCWEKALLCCLLEGFYLPFSSALEPLYATPLFQALCLCVEVKWTGHAKLCLS